MAESKNDLKKICFFGVLSDEKLHLNLEEGWWTFPVRSFYHNVGGGTGGGYEPYEVEFEKIYLLGATKGLQQWLWKDLSKTVPAGPSPFYFRERVAPKAEIIVGTSNIHDWFTGREDLYSAAYEKKGKVSHVRLELLQLYRAFLLSVDLPVPEIPELEEERRQEGREHFRKLALTINAYGDAKIADNPSEEEVQEKREKVIAMLEQAIELGMHNDDYVISIRDLCKQYGVSIPEKD